MIIRVLSNCPMRQRRVYRTDSSLKDLGNRDVSAVPGQKAMVCEGAVVMLGVSPLYECHVQRKDGHSLESRTRTPKIIWPGSLEWIIREVDAMGPRHERPGRCNVGGAQSRKYEGSKVRTHDEGWIRRRWTVRYEKVSGGLLNLQPFICPYIHACQYEYFVRHASLVRALRVRRSIHTFKSCTPDCVLFILEVNGRRRYP